MAKTKIPALWRIQIGFPSDWKIEMRQAAEDAGLNTERWIQQLVRRELDEQQSGDGGAGEYEEFKVDTPVPAQYASEVTQDQLMAEIEEAMKQMTEDFQYPMNAKGDQMDMRFLTPWVAFHLVRCGWRLLHNRRTIKKRRATYIPPGCYEDLVEWVPMDTPDDIDPGTLTLAELKKAPPSVQAQGIRELGGVTEPVLPSGTDLEKLWHQRVNIDVDDPDFEELQKEVGK